MNTMTEQLYKVLGDGGQPHIGGGVWYLPKGKRPGKWMPKVANIIMCTSGYHLVDAAHIVDFLNYGYHIYEAEGRGACLQDTDKSCWDEARLVRELRWGEREARLFACDCAERALDRLAERGVAVDARSRSAVAVSRQYAEGVATVDELSAAWAAAWAAAGDAARAAAWAAAGDAAGAAARAAARAAAGDAAGDAAWDAERQWQTERLLDYLYGRTNQEDE